MDEVKRLSQNVKLQQKWLKQERERQKKSSNENMDQDLPPFLSAYPFWCDECQEDKLLPCRKISYPWEGKVISVMAAWCEECERRILRFITHRDLDPFYQKSRTVRVEKNRNRADMLQEEEFGFRTVYGDSEQRKRESYRIEGESSIYERERRQGLKGQSLSMKEELNRYKKDWI